MCPGLWAHIVMYYYKVCMVIWHPVSLKISFLIFIWISNDTNYPKSKDTCIMGLKVMKPVQCTHTHQSITPTFQVKTLQDHLATPLHSARAFQLLTCGIGDLTIGKQTKWFIEFWVMKILNSINSYIVGLSVTKSLWCTPLLIQVFPLVPVFFFLFCKVACGAQLDNI